ncbi:DNA translocase FtsK 4TM domain-containing protein [Novipirellula sp. SH528]|uniref:FtsK/SpoIIIE family DNA translocase n=1 Tax=Novipirellula sp. SH528 TaxID=3454466 RepID=UPI003FA05255
MASAASNESANGERDANLIRDVVAIVLVAITLIATVSIITRSPADPIEMPIWPVSAFYTPNNSVYPTNPTVTNACGYWGAVISSALLDALGLAAGLVIAAGGGVATALLYRGRLNAPVLRSLGGTIVVVGVATASGLLPMQFEQMPVVGNGGYLGAMTSTFLLEHFAPAGAWILSTTVIAVGLLLTTDYALLYAGKRILAGGAMVSKSGMRRAVKVMPITVRRRRQAFTDLEEPIKIEGDEVGKSSEAEQPAADGNVVEASDWSKREPKIKFKKNRRKTASSDETDSAAGETVGVATMDVPETTASDPAVADPPASVAEPMAADVEEDLHEEVAESEPVLRDIEVDDETLHLRQDEKHSLSNPKIKVPKRKQQADAKQELYDNVQESAPYGSEDYRLPPIELLEQSDDVSYDEQLIEVRRKAQILEDTFKDFGFNIRVVEIETGPVIAQYEIELEAGLRLSKITGLADDLAIGLRVPSVRIVAPIPGKNTVGIEVPNENRQVVRLRDVIEESDMSRSKMNIPVFLGKDVSGNPMVVGLEKMPHLLIAGRTGTGKSVCLNAIITSILMMCRPDEVRMLMIDPKMVELSGYGRLPHLMHPVITDMKKAEAILAWAVEKMEERYSLLAKAGVRHINSYNDLGREEILRRLDLDESEDSDGVPDKLPFIVIIADEMADLMMTAGKDVETHIIRLAQKSRAVGIHLILATQKPTVDVITGLIKSNLPARLSFQVASKTDSRVVLDENGADKLLGNGDMLFLWPGTSTLIRGQGTYLSDEEIDAVVDHCSLGEQNFVGELMNLKVDEGDDAESGNVGEIKNRDELYESAIEVVIREGRGSLSLLQRCLGIGYGRAARLIDFMAEDKIVGEYNGSKSREVLLTMEAWQKMQGLDPDDSEDDDDVVDGAVASNYDDADSDSSDASEEDEYEEYDEDEVA